MTGAITRCEEASGDPGNVCSTPWGNVGEMGAVGGLAEEGLGSEALGSWGSGQRLEAQGDRESSGDLSALGWLEQGRGVDR